MTIPFLKAVLPAIVVSGLALQDPAHAGVRRVPTPCLVSAVPQKKSLPPSVGGPIRLAPDLSYPFRTRGMNPGADGVTRLRVLAIRVDFEGDPMDSTAAYFDRLLFFQRQYYERVSGGKLILDHTLLPQVYRMPRDLAYYGLDDSIGVRESILTYDAVQAADADVDFRDYDRVLVFHSGPGQESDVKDDSREQIWSVFLRQLDFAFYLPYGNPSRGIVTQDRWAPGDTVFVESAAIFPESESQDGFVFSSVGVVCHEFGHGLGLPDLYDTVALEDQTFAESQGVGSWDLMASGTWNANGFVPGEFSAWSKVFLGWIDPLVVTSDQVVTLRAVEEDRHAGVVKIPLTEDEYFLVENRLQDENGDGRFNFEETDSSACFYQKTGDDSTLICLFDFYHDSYAGAEWDYWLPGEGKGSGLLIWHVDQSVIDNNLEYNTVNADPLHKGIDLEEADGIQDMDTPAGDIDAFGSAYDAWRAGNADRFGPDTEPNTDGYYGIRSGISIDQISASGSTMTFRVSFGDRTSTWPVFTVGPIGGNAVGVAELDGDATREVAVADRNGNLYVLNADGSPAWGGGADGIFKALGTTVGTPLLADVDGDNRTDLLVAADDGRVFGFEGGTGAPMGSGGDGLLLTVSHPSPGAELWAADLRPQAPGVEFAIGSAPDPETGASDVTFYSVTAGGEAVVRGKAVLTSGSGPLPGVLLGETSGGRRDLVVSVRSGSPEAPRGTVEIHGLVSAGGTFTDAGHVTVALPDTVFYSAPVAGDLNRDGRMDVVVTGSNGLIYALSANDADVDPEDAGWTVLPGWPVPVFASGNDAVSLADIDGNGYLEVLVLETGGVLHVLNYHGESLVSLPEQVPSETRYFIEPQLAPLVSDLDADGKPEMVLPLRDGQVFAVRADGSRFSSNFFGGGQTGSTPAIEDLLGNGNIELITASHYPEGGRIDVHPLGRASGPPAWSMYRRSGLHDGLLPTDTGAPVLNGPFLSDSFVMPNPARDAARIHYRVGAGVDDVSIEILDVLGRGIVKLSGSSFAGTDNTATWNLTGSDGRPVAPGVYLARIEAAGSGGTRLQVLKFAVIK